MTHYPACPYCGSPRIAVDDERGTIVCQDCGAVIEYLYYEGPPSSHYGEPGYTVQRKRRTGVSRLATTPAPGHTSRYLDPGVERLSLQLARRLARRGRILRRRTLTGLSIYILERLEGAGHNAALREAARRSGASRKRLESLIREYRAQIMAVMEREEEAWVKDERAT